MNVNVKRYIGKTGVDVKSEAAIKKECFAFGYMDGYFDIETYKPNISNYGVEAMEYEKGYVHGVNDRLIKVEEDEKDYNAERKTWLFELAKYDSTNSIENRQLVSKDKEDYKYFYNTIQKARKK